MSGWRLLRNAWKTGRITERPHRNTLSATNNGIGVFSTNRVLLPPDHKAYCDKIKIAGDSGQVIKEYSFERIEQIGTTYLSVGSIPSRNYCAEYVNANTELKR